MNIIKASNFINNSLISVIISSYNRHNIVSEAIDSILNQICNVNFEIIIGDDSSNNDTRNILLEYQKIYPHKIKLIFHEKNIGLAANWATCVKQCNGKYVANCDNDDYWHNPNKLQLQFDFMEANYEYGLVHTDYRKHDRVSGKITDEKAANSVILNEPLQQAVMNGSFKCCNATVMYRKEVIDKYINLDDYFVNNLPFRTGTHG